jgi:hypothetical protein
MGGIIMASKRKAPKKKAAKKAPKKAAKKKPAAKGKMRTAMSGHYDE